MPPKKGGAYYAVRSGRTPGIYTKWDDCKAQVDGFAGAKYQKFESAEQAAAFIEGTAAASSSAQAPTSKATGSTSDSRGKKRGTESMMGPEDDSEWDVVYSDGACKGNGKPGSVAGIGVWWGRDDPRNIAERCPGDQTNNRAELIALLRVLEQTPISKKPLLIRTDSKYSIQCVRDWLPGWVRNGWKSSKGEPVKNAAIIRLISSHLNFRGQQGQKVELAWVKGHSGHEGNDGADYQANLGALQPEMPERDWEAAERELRTRMESGAPASIVEVKEAVDVIPPEPVESPAKKRQRTRSPVSISNATSSSLVHPARSQTPPTSPPRHLRRLADIQAGLSPTKGTPTGKQRAFSSAAPETSGASSSCFAVIKDAPPPSKPNSTDSGSTSLRSPVASPSKHSRLAAIEDALSPPKARSASSRKRSLDLEHPANTTQTAEKASSTSSRKPQSSSAGNAPPTSRPRDIASKAPFDETRPVSPGSALWVAPSLMPVRAQEVNADDYVGCLLSDEDLAQDLDN